eukprot:gene6332-gene6992
MRKLRLHQTQHLLRRVFVDIGVVDDDLDDTEPDRFRDIIARHDDDLHHRVDVPFEVARVLLRQNGDLDDDVFFDGGIGNDQVLDQFFDDIAGIVLVRHYVQEDQGTFTQRHVGVLQGIQDRRLVWLDHLRTFQFGQSRHRIDRQIANVGVFQVDELAQERQRLFTQLIGAVGAIGNDQVDGLEENRVLRVVLIGRIVSIVVLLRSDEGLHEDVVEQIHLRRIGRDLVILQEAQALHLEPRRSNAAVQILLWASVVDHQARQDRDDVRNQRLE